MPEYLAPGVYVEEIDTGSKPIEGVSTSTAGMIGVTERGPVGVPMLVTSYGEFERLFGGLLTADDFGTHRFLPFAVDGFFTNGGKRLFVVRVLDTAAAASAEFTLHDRGDPTSLTSALLRPAPEGSGDAANPLYVLNGAAFAGIAADQPLRIGDGSTAEYRLVDTATVVADPTHVPLHLPLSRNYDAATPVRQINAVAVALPSASPLALTDPAAAGRDQVRVSAAAAGDLDPAIDAAALQEGNLLRVGDAATGEYRFVVRVEIDATDPTRAAVDLDAPLHVAHGTTEVADRFDPDPGGGDLIASGALADAARAGDQVIFLGPLGGDFDDSADLLALRDAGDTTTLEVRRIGDLHELTSSRPTGVFLGAGATVEGVTLADETVPPVRALARAGTVGDLAVALNDRSGLTEGGVLRIEAGAEGEYVTIDALPDRAPGGSDPGNALLTHGLRLGHASGAEVRLQTVAASGRPTGALVLEAPATASRLTVSDGTGYAAGDIVRLTAPSGAAYYLLLEENADDLDAARVALTVPLASAQPTGAPVVERDALLLVQALDAGAWGNRLRVSVADEGVGLLASTTLDVVLPPRQIRLASAAGVETGTVLELVDPATGATVGEMLKVESINRTDRTVTLRADLTAEHLNAIAALPVGTRMRVRSREFSVTVRLYRRPDPAVPSRNETVIDEETFRYLSMDARHSNYVQTIVGAADGPLRRSDRRPEGSSRFVRVHDLAQDLAEPDRTNTLRGVRLGPEALIDVLPTGRTRAARHPLPGGNDALGTIGDATFIGTDAPDPDDRTGLHSLRNIDDVSIVAAPGQLSVGIQSALITHCELMRYRFAVLDGPQPSNDTLADVQSLRQQFDTKYAALYHPWALLPEPFPFRLDDVPLLPIPPSGHVIGIYARTDIERGVHKAPANEVVRGIFSLNRLLTKSEQDLLNPSPNNINVIRDFRPDGRGIRVWGARVITSDPDYKYVPVRRLLIFLEKSIERGLQWVVFEPNAEPLWARVRRSVSDFLRVVWRNGALEGVKEEQAFFVKCDRTTMTQNDIDNGRLICLIGVAPVKPAEFVIIRIGLKTAEAES